MNLAKLDYGFIEDDSCDLIEVAFHIKDRVIGIEFNNEALKKSSLKRVSAHPTALKT